MPPYTSLSPYPAAAPSPSPSFAVSLSLSAISCHAISTLRRAQKSTSHFWHALAEMSAILAPRRGVGHDHYDCCWSGVSQGTYVDSQEPPTTSPVTQNPRPQPSHLGRRTPVGPGGQKESLFPMRTSAAVTLTLPTREIESGTVICGTPGCVWCWGAGRSLTGACRMERIFGSFF